MFAPLGKSPGDGSNQHDRHGAGRHTAFATRSLDGAPDVVGSYTLDAGTGTELNLADCDEHLGRVKEAYLLFDDAAKTLSDEPDRQRFARERADALAAKLGAH